MNVSWYLDVDRPGGLNCLLQGTASAVWQLIAAGRTVPETVAALARQYDGDAAAIERSVTSFVEQLEAESLLIPATAGAPPAPLDERTLIASGAAFSEPAMFRYTDMQALIQMDPIREYDETGWPRRHVPPVPRG